MAQAMLTVRMDPEVKSQFFAVCEQLGMSASAAVNLFARQMIADGGLPFRPSLASSQKSVLGHDVIVEKVQRAAEKFPAIQRVILFGSYARGEADENSDVDLRIEYDHSAKFSLFDLSAFSEELREALGRQVDVVSKRTPKPEFAKEIERDGIVVYER